MTAAELLRDVRRRHGLTQAQLAARARTSQAAISRIERGLVSPTVETLTTLLDLMREQLTLDAHLIDYGHDRSTRLVHTMRGGDRPKYAHEEFPDVSVIPRSMHEPWLSLGSRSTARFATT